MKAFSVRSNKIIASWSSKVTWGFSRSSICCCMLSIWETTFVLLLTIGSWMNINLHAAQKPNILEKRFEALQIWIPTRLGMCQCISTWFKSHASKSFIFTSSTAFPNQTRKFVFSLDNWKSTENSFTYQWSQGAVIHLPHMEHLWLWMVQNSRECILDKSG